MIFPMVVFAVITVGLSVVGLQKSTPPERHVIITTQSGSRYEIDDASCTWKRLEIGNESATTRTPDGTFFSRSEIVIGEPFRMFCPGLRDASLTRLILTTPVVEVEQL